MTTGASPKRGAIASIVRVFLTSHASLLLVMFSLLAGLAAVQMTPREEEPQIVVPMADVLVSVPGASAEEVEKLVAGPLERLLWQVDGVEYVYSVSYRDSALATVRFHVGEDRERSLIKLHNTIVRNQDLVPSIVRNWSVKNVEIDDVPIVMLTFHSPDHSDFDLRRMAEEAFHRIAEVEDVSRVELYGGRSREVRVELDAQRLQALSVSPLEVFEALRGADDSITAGRFPDNDKEIRVSVNAFIPTAEDVSSVVVGVFDGRPVYVRDVADVHDGPQEPESYSRFAWSARLAARQEAGRNSTGWSPEPAVTLAVSKKKGTNAVDVARNVIAAMETFQQTILPDGVDVTVTRNYGATAQAKVDDLLSSLGFAVLTVVVLLAITLGTREAAIVALAVPVSFSLALLVNYLLGYTINRVTLFALILSLGLVVDDPITNVDNIRRHIMMGRRNPLEATLDAVAEVLPPVIMSTLAIIVSFLPLFFISGMMGPYMAPMAANVPLTVTFSTFCALSIVPWAAYHLLRKLPQSELAESGGNEQDGGRIARLYAAVVGPLLDRAGLRWAMIATIVVLLVASLALAALRMVPLKMLPFDNKNEFQIVVDLPEGSTLERTNRVVGEFERYLATVPEVENTVSFVGTASPMDFNGMVRHYYLRRGGNVADIRVNIADKSRREMQSHGIILRLRKDLEDIAQTNGAVIKLVEVPPGPPVLSTITTEVYGQPDRPYSSLIAGAEHVQRIMAREPFVTDIDSTVETQRPMIDFVLDKEKAALHGVSAEAVTRTLAMALGGASPATVHEPDERQPLVVRMVLPLAERSGENRLGELAVKGTSGSLVALAELGRFQTVEEDQPIYHKNLKRVVFVYAEMAGRAPAEAIIDMQGKLRSAPMPMGTVAEWAGEGEWKITLDVFRDLGIAFGAALLGIYVLLVLETGSFAMPLLLMAAIPLTLLGIMPGFWLLNVLTGKTIGGFADPVFFTATSMIGMIALGGIVIRNSVVLIDFIRKSVASGMDLRQAVLSSGAIRLRPIVLTAITTALGAWPITLDPIFSGLAWALIFGLAASTLFTLVVIPVSYYAAYRVK